MTYETITFDVEDHLATITIDRPEGLNATTDTTRTELGLAWARVRDDIDLRIATITGADDRACSAGQDIKATAAAGIRNKIPGSRLHHDVWRRVVCAARNGMVVGGGLHAVAKAMWTRLDVGLKQANDVAYRYVPHHQLMNPGYHEGKRAFAEGRENWVVD